MCGVFAYLGESQQAAEIVFQGLKTLEYRGYDSWGVAWKNVDAAKVWQVHKQVGKIGTSRLPTAISANLAIGHTRWATHGAVTLSNAHPHISQAGDIAVVHNGIVENYQQLKAQLQHRGWQFYTETDTEVIVSLLAELSKTTTFWLAFKQMCQQITGCNAVVASYLPTQEIVAYGGGSPLALAQNKTGVFIVSDAVALTKHAEQVHYLADDELVRIANKKTKLYKLGQRKEKKFNWQPLNFSQSDTELAGFNSFFAKEIGQQPSVIRNIQQNLLAEIKEFSDYIKKNNFQRIIFVGCGTARLAGEVGWHFLTSMANMNVVVEIGSEFNTRRKQLTKHDLVIFLSQSGETIDLLEHIPYLQQHKIQFAALVNRVGSTLARKAAHVILLGAGPEQCVMSTKAYTAKVAVLYLLAGFLANDEIKIGQQLQQFSHAIELLLADTYKQKHIYSLARQLQKVRHIYILGKGIAYPFAQEMALKIKESTYIHAEALATGELKHGSLALIEKDTPCIFVVPDDENYEIAMAGVSEVKARGGFVIGISSRAGALFDFFMPISQCDLLTGLQAVIVAQQLALKITLLLGNDPDKPRNLAKSVTVK